MNFIDIIIVVVVIWFGYKGLKNGLIKELAGIVAITAGIVVAIKLSSALSNILRDFEIMSSEFLPIICFALLFITVVILTHTFSAVVNKFVKMIKLNWLNKIAGMIFGGFKIILILSGLFFMINQLFLNYYSSEISTFSDSTLYYPISNIVEAFFPYIEEIKRKEISF